MNPETSRKRLHSYLAVTTLFTLVLAACTTAPRSANEAVERIFEIRSGFQGASSLANVRVTGEGGQTFRAAVLIDASGAMTLSALTPFGTTAAQVRIENDNVTLVNHLRNTFWEGSLAELSGGPALADAFRVEGLSFLLAGLPPWVDESRVEQEVVAEGLTRLSDGQLSLIVSRSGIVNGTLDLGTDEVAIQFDGQSIPPSRLSVSSSIDPTRIVQFEHIDLDFKRVTLEPLRIPEDYRRAAYWESVIQ